MGKTIDIGGRIHNPEVGNVVTGANEILDDTKNKKQDVINSEVDAALEALDANKQDNLTFDQTPTESSTNPVTSGGVYAADLALQQAIEAILTLIPSAASALNQLADKSFVNSSIATASATFRGTYNLVSDLHLSVTASHQDIATALASAVSTADNNDYCFVQIPTSDTSSDIRVTERYKFNGTAWAYEYDLNNSGFTATQWEAINSGITALLVTKLGALPTAAELATSLAGKQNVLTFDNVPTSGSDNPVKSGGLYQLFAAIDAKMPSDASANNKLVAENRLAAYVTAIIEALDASFDVTSTDGHVTFRITQTNGQIASVQILTSDIASASALTTLTGRVSTNETDIANLQAAYAALTQSDVIIVNGALPSSGQQQNKIYRQPDPDHTPPQFYSDYMWNGSTWVLMATYNNAIDPRPKKGSQNLVTSGGVFDNMGALDVSELNATESPHTLATYADLSAALAAIPSDYQKGGMSIKFVQSSDNKYVQFRYISSDATTAATFTNVVNWQGVDEEPTDDSHNLVESGGVKKQIGQLSKKLFEDEIINRDLSGADQYIGYYPKSVESSNTRLRLDQLSYPNAFDSYGFSVTQKMKIGFDAVPSFSNYFICIVKDETLIDHQGSGNYVIFGSSATKTSKGDNNLPTIANPMIAEVGDYIVVCVPHGETPYYSEIIEGGSNTLNENIELNESQIKQANIPSIKVEILNGTSFNVYSRIGDTNGYLKHKYQRFSYSHTYDNYGTILCGDVWSSPSVETDDGTPLCQGNDNFIYAINPITGFENEEEYKGGGDHGCEVMEWTKFFLDGELFNPAELTPGIILEGSVFKEVFKSKLYASDSSLNSTPNYNTWAKLDNEGNPIVNHIHFLEHTLYGDNKIEQNNRIIAKRNGIQFKQIFGAMCGCYMSASSKLITDANTDIHLIQYEKNNDSTLTVSSGDDLPLLTFNETNTSQNKSGYYKGGYCVQYGDNFLIKQAMEIVEGTHKNMRIWLSGTTISYGQSKVYLSPVVGSDAASKTGLSIDTFDIGDVIEVNNKREISYTNA